MVQDYGWGQLLEKIASVWNSLIDNAFNKFMGASEYYRDRNFVVYWKIKGYIYNCEIVFCIP